MEIEVETEEEIAEDMEEVDEIAMMTAVAVMMVAGEGEAAGLEDHTTQSTGSSSTMLALVLHGRTWKTSSEEEVKWHLPSAIKNAKERELLSMPTQVICGTQWRNWTVRSSMERGWSYTVRAWEDLEAEADPGVEADIEAAADPEAEDRADLDLAVADVTEARAEAKAGVKVDPAPQLMIRRDPLHQNNVNLLQGLQDDVKNALISHIFLPWPSLVDYSFVSIIQCWIDSTLMY